MTDQTPPQWWLHAMGNTLVWARLRELESGTGEVLDCDGHALVYDSVDTARAALLDADYHALDGLDEDDAQAMGTRLDQLVPPSARDDEALRALMIQTLPDTR